MPKKNVAPAKTSRLRTAWYRVRPITNGGRTIAIFVAVMVAGVGIWYFPELYRRTSGAATVWFLIIGAVLYLLLITLLALGAAMVFDEYPNWSANRKANQTSDGTAPADYDANDSPQVVDGEVVDPPAQTHVAPDEYDESKLVPVPPDNESPANDDANATADKDEAPKPSPRRRDKRPGTFTMPDSRV